VPDFDVVHIQHKTSTYRTWHSQYNPRIHVHRGRS